VAAPVLDHDPNFLQRIEDSAVERSVAQPAIEALATAILLSM
jgi:hypothetical protein